MIPHLDFDLIAANPKPFVGYSDITSLHVPIRQRAGFPTFYGYGLMGVGDKDTTDFTRERLLAVLRGDVAGPLTQLRHAGKLDNVKGFVVGEMYMFDYGGLPREAADWRASKSIEDVLDKHLEPLGVPVLYKLPLGHGKHQASIPLGVRYTLDADERTLTVDESPFER